MQRVGEGLDQALLRHLRFTRDRIDDRLTVRAEHVEIDILVQHRMAEAIDDVGELRGDRRVDMHVDAAKDVDGGRDIAREFLEHQMLVLGLGAELRRLEQPFAVPFVGLDHMDWRAGGHAGVPGKRDGVRDGEIDRRQNPVAGERSVSSVQLGLDRILDRLKQAIVLRVENILNGGQPDVLVHPAVAGDVMRVQQFVVVKPRGGREGRVSRRVGIRRKRATEIVKGRGAVRHVVDEGVAGAKCLEVGGNRRYRPVPERVHGDTALDQAGRAIQVPDNKLGQPVRAAKEVAISVGGQQRYVAHVRVSEPDAQEQGVGLQIGPGRHAVLAVGLRVAQQPASGVDLAVGADHVFTQEHLVRRVRGVGLALVDERRGLVGALVDIVRGAQDPIRAGQVGRAGQHHEVAVATRHIQRIVRRQRNEHRAAAALVDHVQAMVEELAEEREPTVGGGRQAVVRRDVVDEQALSQAGNGRTAAGRVSWGRLVAAYEVVAQDIVDGVDDAVRARRERMETWAAGQAANGIGTRAAKDVIRGAKDMVRAVPDHGVVASAKDPVGTSRGEGVTGAINAIQAGPRGVLVALAEEAELQRLRGDRGWIVGGLIGNQVADHARLRVDDQSARGSIRGCLIQRIGKRRKHLIRRAEGALTQHHVVVGAGDLTQAKRQQRINRRLPRFGH